MCRTILLTGILGGAILVSPSFAQNAAPSTPVYDATVVVTATLLEETPENLSAAVTVIDAEAIAERQATEVSQLLATLPGMAVVQSGSPGSITSLFTRGSNSAHTLVLWNGVQLNDAVSGLYDWAHLSTAGVERIEVVRGPFSALWGSDAIGGVVQIISAAPPGGTVRLEAGEHAYRRATAQGALELGRLRLDLSGQTRASEAVLPNDSFDHDEITAHGRFAFAPDREIGLRLRWSDSDLGLPRDFLDLPSRNRHQTRESRELTVPARFAWGDFEVDAQASRTDSEIRLDDPDNPFDRSATETETSQGRAVLAYRPRAGLWLGGGADWKRQEATTSSAFGPGLARNHQRTLAVFAQSGLAIGRFHFDAGVRRDDNDAFGSATTSKLGAIWRARDGLRVRASYGEGFHAPTLADLYFPGFSNPNLQPERSASTELGIDFERATWKASLALFETDFSDLIQFDFTTFQPFNTGRAESRGVELELGWHADELSLRWNGTYLEAEDASGARLLRRPRESANLIAVWAPNFAAGGWTLHGTARYVGDRVDFGAELPSYATLEAGAAWRPARVAWLEVSTRVENALDRRYEEVAGFPALGRRWIGGVGARF